MSRPAYRLTREAEADCAAILRHTLNRFGRAQFNIYRAILNRAVEAVATEPDRPGSRRRPELGEGVRTFHATLAVGRAGAARHLVVYRPTPDGVQVLRLLHDSMDLARPMPDAGTER